MYMYVCTSTQLCMHIIIVSRACVTVEMCMWRGRGIEREGGRERKREKERERESRTVMCTSQHHLP